MEQGNFKSIVYFLKDDSVVKNFGKIWNIVQPAVSAVFEVYLLEEKCGKNCRGNFEKNSKGNYNQNSKKNFKEICKEDDDKKYIENCHKNCGGNIIKSNFLKNIKIYENFTSVDCYSIDNINNDLQFLAGMNSGNLVFFKFLRKHNKFTKMKKIHIFKEPVNMIKKYPCGIFIIGDKSIRIFDFTKKKIISGGSLNSRLEDKEYIKSFFYNEKNNYIFLFTNKKKMFIFKNKNVKLNYILEKNFEEDIIYNNYLDSNLIIGTKNSLEFYKILNGGEKANFILTGKIDRNFIVNFPNLKIENYFSSFFVDKINLFIYIGDDHGNIYVFDLKNGNFLSSLEIHTSKLFGFDFIYSKNMLLTFCEEEGKIFKIGYLNPEDEENNYRSGYKKGIY